MIQIPVLIFIVTAALFYDVSSSKVAICVMNCAQCKQMFGMFFHGQACAESCLASQGLASPDCNNPTTVKIFLKRLL